MRLLRLLTLALLLPAVLRAAEPFEIKTGDRVLFLGDTLLEREGTYGYLETRMHEQFPDRHFTVRNLSWSGETPRGWSRASFDNPDKGTERLKEDIAKVRPTVVFLGFGMAASLQEMTDRSADITLNPDPQRYGAEPMSAARFKKELGELMDAIIAQAASATAPGSTPVPGVGPGVSPGRTSADAASAGNAPSSSASPEVRGGGTPPPTPGTGVLPGAVRFVLLSPIRHEDLRAVRPGLPDPAPHNALLEQYSKAIEELAQERGGRMVFLFKHVEDTQLTDNGIHLRESGYRLLLGQEAGRQLGWSLRERDVQTNELLGTVRKTQALRAAVIRKNELFFHQFRPANSTYLFGFRKHEQGQNAKEMPMFDPLIEAAEAEIDRLKRGAPAPGSTPVPGVGSGVSPERTSGGATSGANAASQAAPPEVRGGGTPSPTPGTGVLPGVSGPIAGTPPPLPDFTVEDGYQIELWAQNPYLEKPTQINWDPLGRLWVCSSSLYPQIEPGQAANDKILVLSDTDGDGKADKSEVFVDGLLIPTGVVPDLVPGRVGVPPAGSGVPPERTSRTAGDVKSPVTGATPAQVREGGTPSPAGGTPTLPETGLSPSACYVGQSTELLHFTDTDGDGRADTKRIVFSGFGTEDTHHIVHTLHWGPDGRLFFHQSVYIHSHLETPWGMVRLNSGGVFAYDPRTERVEVFAKGLWNTWGQQEDDWGQTFLTDGAGSNGISWAFPGATFAPFEGSRRQMPSVSPGAYPKFAGLELIKSPHFPAEWQGNAVTCDFRAHRIVRFAIEDLSLTAEAQRRGGEGEKSAASTSTSSSSASPRLSASAVKSGYVTTEQPDLVRTTDLSFRPIDVRLGPDGALYVADWSNPVINHGEVDFRDPRRDHHMGRIWRISRKDAKPLSWEPLLGKKNEELLEKLLSKSAWEKEQARITARVLSATDTNIRMAAAQLLAQRNSTRPNDTTVTDHDLELERFGRAIESGLLPMSTGNGEPRWLAAIVRDTAPGPFTPGELKAIDEAAAKGNDVSAFTRPKGAITSANPRVRLEAMRALARIPTARSAELVLDAAVGAWDADGKGSTRAPRVVAGAPAGTTSPAGAAALQNGAARAANESPAGAPATTRGARVLPEERATAIDDPHYDFAAWLSINDLAKPWTDAIASGAWKTEGKEAQLAYGLKSIDPTLASATLSRLFAAGQVPVDGSGPWIELIGDAGGPAELQRLLDGLLAGYVGDCCETDATRAIDTKLALTGPVAFRAVAALQTAARVRAARPAAHADLVTALFHSQGDIGLGAIRLAGLWKAPDAVAKITELLDSRETKPPLRRAAVDGLRAAGGPAALQLLDGLTRAEEVTDTRAAALVAMAQVKLDAGVMKAAEILPTLPEDALLGTWRGLLGVKGAPDAFAVKFGKQEGAKAMPAPVLVAAQRAAQELGRPGVKLLAALAPAGGAGAGAPSTDYVGLAAQTVQNGDPAKGELIYRRATSACTTCHAIGGAGGKVGPDMTSIGASAPLDYLIESILNPNAKVKEGFNAVALTLLDGAQVTGIQARETASELILRDAAGAEKGVPKAMVKAKTDIGSMMPAGLTAMMKPREAIDLYAFLSQLGKPGPYDASKGRVARVWRMYPGTAAGEVVSAAYDPAKHPGFPGYTLVDGRFVNELLAEATMIASGGAETVLLATQFQSSGKTRLKLTGAEKAWLDGAALVLGGDLAPELPNGTHTLVVKLGVKELPALLRAESPDARFLGN